MKNIMSTFSEKAKRIIISIFMLFAISSGILTYNDWPSYNDDHQLNAFIALIIGYWVFIILLNWIRKADKENDNKL